MFKMDFVQGLKLNRKVTAQLMTLKFSKLKLAIVNEDPTDLIAINGIGEKTAATIIERGRALMAPKKEFHVPHYVAAAYSIWNMFTRRQCDLLEAAKSATTPNELLNKLRVLSAELDGETGPLSYRGVPDYHTLPASMLSDILGIVPNTETNKVCLFKFALNARSIIPETMVLNRAQRNEINSIVTALKSSVVWRAVRYGFSNIMGLKYKFFTCSPGQLKKQSGYWMEAQTFSEHQKLFWGNLTPSEINRNCTGKDGVVKGIAMTKILQYRALLTSSAIKISSVIGKQIKLRNLICVGEHEKAMSGNVMTVTGDYKVIEGFRDDIMNNMFDGMCLFNAEVIGWIMLQLRCFGFKGLGVPVDWKGYCNHKDYNSAKNWKIKDVDGVVHDLRKEKNICGIVNTSVFKMLKMFGSWKHYVECMEQLGLDELYVCGVGEESSKTKRLSRQMTQSMFDITDDELEYVSSDSMRALMEYNDLECAINIMSESDREYEYRTNIAKLITQYPDVLALPCVQKKLRDKYVSKYNSAMAGELKVNGRYYYVAADPCAYMDILFGKKEIDDPELGWLKADECFCTGYPNASELITLRSPHAFMEWAVLNQANPCPFVMSSGIYTSVHDLTFRILQMDYDGDHLLVIDDQILVNKVKRIKAKYDIPVVYYEPDATPNPGPMPASAHEFCLKICECIEKCAEYNKVGQYSNLVTAAWSTYRPDMNHAELRGLLRDIAIIAAGINHAVDAQKTYHLVFLEELVKEIVEKYNFKPFNERHKSASPDKPNNHPSWDAETAEKGEGSVDRLGDVLRNFVDERLSIDTSSLKFDWQMLKNPDERINKQICKSAVSKDLVVAIKRLGESNNEVDAEIIKKMEEGNLIGFSELFPLLSYLNAIFFKEYREDEEDKDGSPVRITNEYRNNIIRNIVLEFIRSGTPSAKDLDDEEVIAMGANSALKMVFNASKHAKHQKFTLELFGDKYAEAVLMNEARGYVPTTPDEFDYDISEYDIPVYDSIVGNELNDI